MTVSTLATCPLCNKLPSLDLVAAAGETPCPHCGSLLWFCRTEDELHFHAASDVPPIREKITSLLVDRLQMTREQITDTSRFMEDLGADSLDVVELIMELEAEYDLTVPDEEGEKIKTLAAALDYILLRRQMKSGG